MVREACPGGSWGRTIHAFLRSRGLIVITGNLAEFTRVAGLRCEDRLGPTAG